MGGRVVRVCKYLAICLVILLLAVATAWGVLALWYRLPVAGWAKIAVCGAFATIGIAIIIAQFTQKRRNRSIVTAVTEP